MKHEEDKIKKTIFAMPDAEIMAGIVMVFGGVLAIFMTNSDFDGLYQQITDFTLMVGVGTKTYAFPLRSFVHEGLMVIFFAQVAMELKLEMNEGVISQKKQMALPLAAAVGGMIFPAIIYYLFNMTLEENHAGIAIPCATDIAFAVAIYNVLANKMPQSVKIFLLSIAIFDDLGAIIIIALFYNTDFNILPMMISVGIIAFIYILSVRRIARFWIYIAASFALWLALHEAGVHTTMAGVIFGLALPIHTTHPHFSPLKAAMGALHPWVIWVILPFFAFTACEIKLGGMQLADLANPIAFGIAAGLFIGKQIGIFLPSWILIKTDTSPIPEGANWVHIYYVACLAGIGFTMSLFIGELAFPGEGALQNLVKIGIIAGSVLSAIWGALALKIYRALRA